MPLHRNKSSSHKILNFKGRHQSCFVKENHHLSRELCTVLAIVSSSKELKLAPLEIAFKGKLKFVFKVKEPKSIHQEKTAMGR